MLSIFRYPGGKSKVRSRILNLAPNTYSEYREPFVGGGGVFFGIPPVTRWINDKHTGVVAVYEALRDRPVEFIEDCRSIPTAKRCALGTGKGRGGSYSARYQQFLFNEFLVDETVDEALRYFLIHRCAYAGRVVYGDPRRTHFTAPEGWNVVNGKRLEGAAEVMQNVRVTCGDFEPLFKTEGDNVWVYADPPYISDTRRTRSAKLYEHSFTMDDHERLASVVRSCPHQVLLSYDDDADGIVRSLYKGFDFVEESWLYNGVQRSKGKIGRELLIANYDLSS